MKTKTLIQRGAIVAASLGAGGLAMALLGHKVVHTELVIPAAPEAVWTVLTDSGGYADWNPIFVHVEGEYRHGAKMRYLMRNDAGRVSEVTSTVVRFDVERELNQFGGVRGLLTFDHVWRLERVPEGTRVVQHEEYRGLGVWFWDASWVEPMYMRANEALRERVVAAP
ncbi:MAG: SRPBCC domain-containing protein [Acidobacteriota bacterium]